MINSSMETLSSSATFFYKFILPSLWIGLFGLVTITMFVTDSASSNLKWQFLGAWIIGGVLIYMMCARIKKVMFDGSLIYVSNYFESDTIEISKVLSVSGTILLSPELVWFKVKEETSFGDTIIFMPKFRLLSGFSKSPAVKKLKIICGIQS